MTLDLVTYRNSFRRSPRQCDISHPDTMWQVLQDKAFYLSVQKRVLQSSGTPMS